LTILILKLSNAGIAFCHRQPSDGSTARRHDITPSSVFLLAPVWERGRNLRIERKENQKQTLTVIETKRKIEVGKKLEMISGRNKGTKMWRRKMWRQKMPATFFFDSHFFLGSFRSHTGTPNALSLLFRTHLSLSKSKSKPKAKAKKSQVLISAKRRKEKRKKDGD